MVRFFSCLCIGMFMLVSTVGFSVPQRASLNQLAYLCGPDEDGCQPDDPSSCSCIKQSSSYNGEYCLHYNLDNSMTCQPNPSNKPCSKGDYNEKTEQACVSDALQAGSVCPVIHFKTCQNRQYVIQNIKHLI